jgi:acyl-CoA reductase-like NAD-dependent aldehyde dehydrogenase
VTGVTIVDGETFQSVDPASGEPVGTFPVHSEADVQAAVARARPAAEWWAGLGFAGRADRLGAFRAGLAGRPPSWPS